MKSQMVSAGIVLVNGADWIQRYFQVMQSCARAAQIKLEQRQSETAAR